MDIQKLHALQHLVTIVAIHRVRTLLLSLLQYRALVKPINLQSVLGRPRLHVSAAVRSQSGIVSVASMTLVVRSMKCSNRFTDDDECNSKGSRILPAF
jgi:hypothetical protein